MAVNPKSLKTAPLCTTHKHTNTHTHTNEKMQSFFIATHKNAYKILMVLHLRKFKVNWNIWMLCAKNSCGNRCKVAPADIWKCVVKVSASADNWISWKTISWNHFIDVPVFKSTNANIHLNPWHIRAAELMLNLEDNSLNSLVFPWFCIWISLCLSSYIDKMYVKLKLW